jgi:ATP-binding cassette subfamily B (MDR/TAP) protein 1
MLSSEATAMSALSGTNLGAILTLIVSLVSVVTLAYHPPILSDGRIAFAWKLGLVALSILPVQIVCGFFRFRLQRTLSDTLRKAYAKSADVACEQVAAIRTVASLNRERYVLEEFEESLKQPVHEALIKTLKSSGVRSSLFTC